MAHLGVLKALEQSDIVVDMIAGTSAGAMTGVFYAANLNVDYRIDSFVKEMRPPWLFRQIPAWYYWNWSTSIGEDNRRYGVAATSAIKRKRRMNSSS